MISAVKRTFADGDVSMPDVVIGPMPVVSFDQHGTPSLLTPIGVGFHKSQIGMKSLAKSLEEEVQQEEERMGA